MILRRALAIGNEGLIAGGALTAGVVGAAVAARFGGAAPTALLVVAAIGAVVLLTLHDARTAVLAVFATFPIANVATGLPFLQATEAAALGLAVVVAVAMTAIGETSIGWSPRLLWPVALLAWALVALPTAIDRTLALKQVAQLVVGLVFASLVIRTCRSSGDVRRLLAGLVAAGIVITAIGLLSGGADQLRPEFEGATVKGRLSATFNQPNQLGAFAAIAAIAALTLAVSARTRRGRNAAVGAFALILPGLLLSLSRGGWIGFGVGLCTLLVAVGRSRVVGAVILPLVLVIGVLAAGAPYGADLSVVTLRAEALTTRSPYDQRGVIYSEAWHEILEHPWVGVGPGGFQVASARGMSQLATVRAYHAHNIFLTWGAECGLPAAGIIAGFAIALALAVRRAARAASRRGDAADQALAIGLGAVLLAVLAQGMVDYVFRNEVLFLSLWAVIASVLVLERSDRTGGRFGGGFQ